jgi:hypothetical protein
MILNARTSSSKEASTLLSGALNGNGNLEKRLAQNVLPDLITCPSALKAIRLNVQKASLE